MNKHLLYSLLLLPFMGKAQAQEFTLQGKIGTLNAPAKVYIAYSDAGTFRQDSAIVHNGSFQLQHQISEPVYAQLTLDHDGQHANRNVDAISLFLEPGNIQLSSADSIKHATISGSPINADAQRLDALLAPSAQRLDSLNAAYYSLPEDQRADSLVQQNWNQQVATGRQELRSLQLQFIEENPASYMSLFTLIRLAGQQINVAEIRPIYNSLSAEVRSMPPAKRFEEAMDKSINTAIGALAPDFSQPDSTGQTIKLSDFRGKYVLLDFWASWCIPCRAENPNVKKAYEQYKNKNFTVLGVSLDRSNARASWLKAIQHDGLTWPQVSDLKFWDNEAAVLYGLKSIPQNFLIDPQGKIIAKNLRGEALQETLQSLLGE